MNTNELKEFQNSSERIVQLITSTIDFPDIGKLPNKDQLIYNSFYNWFGAAKSELYDIEHLVKHFIEFVTFTNYENASLIFEKQKAIQHIRQLRLNAGLPVDKSPYNN